MWGLEPAETSALALTLKLSLITTVLLLLFALPLSWWLSQTQSRTKPWFEAAIALPLVMPPTVLGFYLLLLLSPNGLIGGLFDRSLAFSFQGLVLGSFIYSLPFVVQPLQSAFRQVHRGYLDSATMLGMSPLKQFLKLVLPMSKAGILSAAVLGFAHTIGEFGVVLMIGGSIPDETRVLSIAIYESVELMDYSRAHRLSFILLASSFVLLLWVYKRGASYRVGQ